MTIFYNISLFISVCIVSLLATQLVLGYLKKKAILDHPNERSSHSIPVPRGGGLGLLIAIVPSLFLVNFLSDSSLALVYPVLFCASALALLSWFDDLHNLSPSVRFLTQFACVSLCIYLLPATEQGYLGNFLPLWGEKIILTLGWVWFINLFNFMDGIDGISGIEISSIALGIILIALLVSLPNEFIQTGLILFAAAIGFLRWNWHPAQVFMGDVGSVPIGFILGWLLILIGGEGYLLLAVLPPLYYLSDATITLIKRAFRKEKVWQAHRDHYYQRANKAGLAHNVISKRILLTNLVLIFTIWVSLKVSLLLGLLIAMLAVGLVLFSFDKRYKTSL
ncbi:MraY family glycosyltransferase [Candidatus Terasakiella magnetica]|uniref:MraY family glycosyltransferase n=1 Tax=Candidatus Terasakiella magnetica TaxID=1867952 RepID=UPI0013F4DBD8|nr:glycosyltransferase family 4 protein [Candidatus Terasakiella magnetica]